ELEQIGTAVAGARDVAIEALARPRHGHGRWEGTALRTVGRRTGGAPSQVLDQRAHHSLGGAPRTIGRADRLDDVLEDRRTLDHAPGAARDPPELRVVSDGGVEG